MEIFKIIGVGILTCIVCVIIKQIKPEFYIVVLLSGGIIIALLVLKQLQGVMNYILTLFNKTNLNYSYFSLILKILGVGYLTEFASSVCVDSGNSSIAEKILIGGKVIILCLALPIITNLLDLIIGFLPK